MKRKNTKAIIAASIAAIMMAGTSITSFAATAQEVIAKTQTSYTAGKDSVYGAKLTQEQLNAVAKAVADFKTNYIKDSMDHDAKIRAGYDYLKNNVKYIDWRDSTYANTAYGALVEHKAACSGMTRAFVALMDAVDVKAYWIHGSGNSHQWNMVEFNDGFYFIDVDANISSGSEVIYKASKHPYAYDTAAYPAIGSKSGGQKTVSEGWKQDAKGWWYQNADGSYPAGAWKQVNGAWYYFEGSGYMASNRWIGNYYVGSDGAMLTNTTTPDGYQVGADGAWIQSAGNMNQNQTAQQTNYIVDSNGLTSNTNTGWYNDNGQMSYKKPDGQYCRMEWARIDGKDYYFDISAHVEWELELPSARNRQEKSITDELKKNGIRDRGVKPGSRWQSDTHRVWYKKADGTLANFFLWQSNILAGDSDYGWSYRYLRLDGEKQKNVFYMRDATACFGSVGEMLQKREVISYADQDGETVFSIAPDGTVTIYHPGGDTYSLFYASQLPQLYWNAVKNGEIPEEYQYVK